VLVVDFIFTRCSGPCPILTARNVQLQRALDADLRGRVRFVSISLDPERHAESPPTRPRRGPGSWSFLTGPEADVAEVVPAGVGMLRAPDGNIDHALVTFLSMGRDGSRRWLGSAQVDRCARRSPLVAAAPAGS
jgi:cytochrome oxidase Cu insertion factor (SCO1/SenC/PrrC family)